MPETIKALGDADIAIPYERQAMRSTTPQSIAGQPSWSLLVSVASLSLGTSCLNSSSLHKVSSAILLGMLATWIMPVIQVISFKSFDSKLRVSAKSSLALTLWLSRSIGGPHHSTALTSTEAFVSWQVCMCLLRLSLRLKVLGTCKHCEHWNASRNVAWQLLLWRWRSLLEPKAGCWQPVTSQLNRRRCIA